MDLCFLFLLGIYLEIELLGLFLKIFFFSSSPMKKIHFTSLWLLKKSCLSQKVQKCAHTRMHVCLAFGFGFGFECCQVALFAILVGSVLLGSLECLEP